MKKKRLEINAVLNGIKQSCTIIFPMITFPYISRVLGATNYGKINFASSVVSYFALVAALGINNYAVREGARIRDDKKKLEAFVDEVYSLNILSSLISLLGLFLLVMFSKKINPYRFIIIIQTMDIIFKTLGTDWINVIFEDYVYITVRYIVCYLVAILLMFGFVKTQEDYLIYAFTNIAGSVFANCYNIGYIRKKLDIHPRFFASSGIIKHIKPILIIFSSSIALQIYVNSDITLLGIFQNDTVVGYYSVAVKVYLLVKSLINSFMQVGIPRFSFELSKSTQKDINTQYYSIFSILVVFLGPACVGLYSLSDNIIELFGGVEYLAASKALQFLSIALFFASLACFFINIVMLPARMDNKILFATMVSAIVNVIGNIVLIPKYSLLAAAFTTILSESIMVALGIYYTKDILDFSFTKPLLLSVLCTSLVYIICSVIKTAISNSILQIIISMCISGVVVIVIVFLAWRRNGQKAIIAK